MLRQIVLVSGILAGLALAADGVHYLRWSEMPSLVPEVTSSKQWDSWIRQRDYEIRAGVDRYVEDAISTLIMFGTSFTAEPRLASAAEAVNAAGGLTPAARLRMDAFIEGLDRMDDERFRSILQFLRRRQISQEELRAYLSGNLRRAALERSANPHIHVTIGSALIDQALRALLTAGQPVARVRRIGVIGPGLDPDYDPDTYNLFAVLESALSTGLSKPGSVEAVVFDINPWVLSHVRAMAAKGGARYNARLRAEDLNIVTQTVETAPGQGFDLVFLSNSPAAHSAVEQSLVLANLARMMTVGAVLLTGSAASGTVPQEFEAISGLPEGIAAFRRK